MNKINGNAALHLSNLLDKYIGTLMYQEFPVTAVFADKNGLPVLKEWLDCEGEVHRFFVYSVSKNQLTEFLQGKISHFDLFYTTQNGLSFLFDETDKGFKNIKPIIAKDLIDDYLPSIDSFFKIENGVDTGKIATFFKLQMVEQGILAA